MRGGRSLLVLFVAFGGLLAYLYFVDAKKPVTEEGAEKRDKVFTVEADKINELKVRGSSGETSTSQEGQGRLAARSARRVQGRRWRGLGDHQQPLVCRDPECGRRGAEGCSPLRARQAARRGGVQGGRRQGLPSAARRQQDADRRRPLRAARRAARRCSSSRRTSRPAFDRKPFDLRDKKILAFDRDKVDRLEIAHGDVKLELVKAGQDWNITAPVQAKADFSSVETIVTRLQSAQMKSLPVRAGDRPEGVRARQARGHRHRRPRKHPRDAGLRQDRRGRRRLRKGRDAPGGGHRRAPTCSPTSRRTHPICAARTSSSSARSMRSGSR